MPAAIADIVADIIRDGCRVRWIILGDARFNPARPDPAANFSSLG